MHDFMHSTAALETTHDETPLRLDGGFTSNHHFGLRHLPPPSDRPLILGTRQSRTSGFSHNVALNGPCIPSGGRPLYEEFFLIGAVRC
jgi:hypothetical protein